MEDYVPVTNARSTTTAAATTAAASKSLATPPYTSSPLVGIDYSFIAAPPGNIASQPVEFNMTAGSGGSNHFIINQLLPDIELRINHFVHLNPPVTIKVAGSHRNSGVGEGVVVVQVLGHLDSKQSGQLPVTIVPGLARHLFSGRSAATKEVNMVISNNSNLDMGAFTVPLRRDSHCSLLWIISTSSLMQLAEHLRQAFRPF